MVPAAGSLILWFLSSAYVDFEYLSWPFLGLVHYLPPKDQLIQIISKDIIIKQHYVERH